jgi:hypothetical protein
MTEAQDSLPCARAQACRVKIMGLIITRTDWDFPTFLHFCDPIIFTRTRHDLSHRNSWGEGRVKGGAPSTVVIS